MQITTYEFRPSASHWGEFQSHNWSLETSFMWKYVLSLFFFCDFLLIHHQFSIDFTLPDCFVVANNTTKKSNETLHFMDLLHTTDECFQDHLRNKTYSQDVCSACEEPYCAMNKFYDQLKNANSQNSICMDIVDSVCVCWWSFIWRLEVDYVTLKYLHNIFIIL